MTVNKEQFTMVKGVVKARSWNLTNAESDLSNSASSVTWSSNNDSIATVAYDAIANSITTFTITSIAVGNTTLVGLVTFDDGTTDKLILELTVQTDGS